MTRDGWHTFASRTILRQISPKAQLHEKKYKNQSLKRFNAVFSIIIFCRERKTPQFSLLDAENEVPKASIKNVGN